MRPVRGEAVRQVAAHAASVRRDGAHRHAVHPAEFPAPLPGRAGHAAQQRVAPEILLVGDGGDGHALAHQLKPFLDLQRLPEPVAVAAAVQHAPGVRVDDLQLAVRDDVVHVAPERAVRLNRLEDHVGDGQVVRKRLEPKELLGVALAQRREHRHALAPQHDVVELLVEPPVLVLVLQGLHGHALQVPHEPVHRGQQRMQRTAPAGENHRGHGLVEQDAVCLVYQHERRLALHLPLFGLRQLIAQVVKAELAVRAVEHVAGVGGLFLLKGHPRLGHGDADAQRLVHRAHPLAVAPGEVGVDRGDVRPPAAERVQARREHGGHGLALARVHLRHAALRHRDGAQHLLGVRGDGESAPERFVHQRIRLGAHAPDVPPAKGLHPPAQRLVRQGRKRCGHGKDPAQLHAAADGDHGFCLHRPFSASAAGAGKGFVYIGKNMVIPVGYAAANSRTMIAQGSWNCNRGDAD